MQGIKVALELHVKGRRFGSAIAIVQDLHKATKAELDALPEMTISYEDAKSYQRMFEKLIVGYEETLDKYE